MEEKILVVYYSESGNTKKAANNIAELTNAVVEEIKTPYFDKGFWAYLKRSWSALRQESVPINTIINNPALFDLVIVGSPVWAGHIASPVRSYLEQQTGNISKVAFYVTFGGRGRKGAFRDMREITGLTPIKEISIRENDFKTGKDTEKMNYFIYRLGL